MTQMTIVDVVNIVYPGQIEEGNVTLGQDVTGPIFITKWTVPDIPEPTVEELEAMIPSLQAQFDLWFFVTYGTPQLAAYVDSIAQDKQYANAVSCASYVNSGVAGWKAEAEAFIAWRDAVYNYVIVQQALMQDGQRSVPSFDNFKTELPVISWPS